MKYGILYEIENKINNKKYIGITYRSLNERWQGHKSKAKNGDKRPLYRAIRKYGIDNFEIKTLNKDVPDNFLNLLEQLWIKELNLTDRKYGYNLALGGKVNKGYKIPIDVVERQKERMIGKGNPFYGKHHSEKTRRTISEKAKNRKSPNKGITLSEETKRKISESKTGISTATEEMKTNLSKRMSGKQNPSSRSVQMISKDGYEVIMTFDTIKEAVLWIIENTEQEMKIMRSMIGSIVRVCKNKTKSAYGFKWKYIEEGQTTIPRGSTSEDELPMEVQDTL